MLETHVAFDLINNLDRRESVRKYGPAYAVVVVNPRLQIERVARFKDQPETGEVAALMSEYPTSAYFYTNPGIYRTVESLQEKVASCAEAFLIKW